MEQLGQVASERRSILLTQAQREIPRILIGSCLVIALFDIALILTSSALPREYFASDLLQFLVIALVGITIRSKLVPRNYVPWLFGLAVITNNLVMNFQFVIDPTGNSIAVIMIMLSVTGALIFDWRAFIVVAGVANTVTAWTFFTHMETGAEEWIIAALTATAMSALILWGRTQTATALAQAAIQAAELATIDPLTGLLNRRGIEHMELALHRRALREQQFVFVMFCDIDGLKYVNDTDGHGAGDVLLSAVSRALTQAVRPDDLVARWGGDEFLVIGLGQVPAAHEFKERLDRQLASEPLPPSWTRGITIGSSLGFNQPLPEIIEQADAAMYQQRHRS